MMIVLSYDVSTTDEGGARRLHRVAKLCERFGVRVQNSVFELLIDPAQLVTLKAALQSEINEQQDSVRLYQLGANWKGRIEQLGKPQRIEQESPLIL